MKRTTNDIRDIDQLVKGQYVWIEIMGDPPAAPGRAKIYTDAYSTFVLPRWDLDRDLGGSNKFMQVKVEKTGYWYGFETVDVMISNDKKRTLLWTLPIKPNTIFLRNPNEDIITTIEQRIESILWDEEENQ